MMSGSTVPSSAQRADGQTWLFAIAAAYSTVTVCLSLLVAYVFQHSNPRSLYALSFEVGPTAQSLLAHHGLTFVGATGTPGNNLLFRSGRMPIASLFIAACAAIWGPDALLQAAFFKVTLCMAALSISSFLALRSFRSSKGGLLMCGSILLVPFLIPAFLADVANLQVEEGYTFALLILAIGLISFVDGCDISRTPLAFALFAGLVIDLVYLSKSSMILVSAVLACAAMLRLKTISSRLVLMVIVICAPTGWAIHQHAVSGRFTVGTSLDGANFHKGNNEFFLTHYPPKPPDNLDNYEGEFTKGHVFSSEWEYNDWHKSAAKLYIRQHPRDSLIALGRKICVVLFALVPYGSGPAKLPFIITLIGLALFRVSFWAAFALSVYCALFKPGSTRFASVLFLGVSGACVLPYLLGFGYVRHASVLIYPSALCIVRLLPSVLKAFSTVPVDATGVSEQAVVELT